jgi:hypothetical protein
VALNVARAIKKIGRQEATVIFIWRLQSVNILTIYWSSGITAVIIEITK